jgi:hypothetical protein
VLEMTTLTFALRTKVRLDHCASLRHSGFKTRPL